MPALHILFAIPAYPPFPGGGERYAAALATHLAARGHRITVVTSTAQQEPDMWLGRGIQESSDQPYLNPQIIRCPVLPMPGGRRGLLAWRKGMVLLSLLPGSRTGMLMRMARRIPAIAGMDETLSSLDTQIDLVHGFNISWEYAIIAGWQFASSRGLPYLITPFAHLGSDGNEKVALNSTMDHQRWLMADADALLTLTSIEAEGLRQRGAAPASVSVIGAGLDPFPPPADGQNVRARFDLDQPFALFIGRASYDKGAIHAAQAVLMLNKQGIAIDLVLVGAISEDFKHFFARLTVEERRSIRPVGIVDETTKHALLDESALLMLPSRTDSFGIVILEAWAHGKPVIAARAGGISGVVDDGINGCLVRFGDVQALAETARLLLVDQSLSQRMGEDGREKVRIKYNWGHLTDQVLDTYQSALRRY